MGKVFTFYLNTEVENREFIVIKFIDDGTEYVIAKFLEEFDDYDYGVYAQLLN